MGWGRKTKDKSLEKRCLVHIRETEHFKKVTKARPFAGDTEMSERVWAAVNKSSAAFS